MIAEEHLAELRAIGERVQHQDNRVTADPLFIVQVKNRIYGLDSDFAETFVWVCDGEEVCGEEAQRYDELEASGKDLPDNVERRGFIDIWKFVTGCFTEAGAQAYIDANRHNLLEPRIYAATLYRNYEMISIRQALKEIYIEGDGA